MSRWRGTKAGQAITALIADLAITTAKIAAAAVTSAKLAANLFFTTASRTDATTTPTVTSADSNGTVRVTSASNIDVTFDATCKVLGFRCRIIKGNAGTNTINFTPPSGARIIFLGATGTTATSTSIPDGNSTLQPSWDVEYDGADLIVS